MLKDASMRKAVRSEEAPDDNLFQDDAAAKGTPGMPQAFQGYYAK